MTSESELISVVEALSEPSARRFGVSVDDTVALETMSEVEL